MIRTAICGCGSISKFRHAPEYAENPHVKLVGYYDAVPERAKELADKFGGKVYDTAEALLTDPDVDAVSICTSNKYHCEYTVLASNHGKHVLCEKPMAMSVPEGEAMIKAARDNGKMLMIAQNQRLAPAHAKAKQLVAAGEIGKILTFRTIFGHRGPEYWTADKSINTWFFRKGDAFIGCIGDLGVHKSERFRPMRSR